MLVVLAVVLACCVCCVLSTPTLAPTIGVDYSWSLVNEDSLDYANLGGMQSSNSGQYVIAYVEYSGIFVSNDYGNTWSSPLLNSYAWSGASVSANGSVMAACSYSSSSVYVSMAYGNTGTWVNVNPAPNSWNAIAVDEIGANIVLTGAGYGLYHSSNFGRSWTTSLSASPSWTYVYLSRGGPYGVASATSALYKTSDSGASWVLVSYPEGELGMAQISSDGQNLVYLCTGGICCSNNGGANYTIAGGNTSETRVLTASAAGDYVLACDYQNRTLQSIDYGQTFITVENAPECNVLTSSNTTDKVIVWNRSVYLGIEATVAPTTAPSIAPTVAPSVAPTEPTVSPTECPSVAPSVAPTIAPTTLSTSIPTLQPTTSTDNANTDDDDDGGSKLGMSPGVIAGVAIGVVVFVGLAMACVNYLILPAVYGAADAGRAQAAAHAHHNSHRPTNNPVRRVLLSDEP